MGSRRSAKNTAAADSSKLARERKAVSDITLRPNGGITPIWIPIVLPSCPMRELMH